MYYYIVVSTLCRVCLQCRTIQKVNDISQFTSHYDRIPISCIINNINNNIIPVHLWYYIKRNVLIVPYLHLTMMYLLQTVNYVWCITIIYILLLVFRDIREMFAKLNLTLRLCNIILNRYNYSSIYHMPLLFLLKLVEQDHGTYSIGLRYQTVLNPCNKNIFEY